MHTRLRLLLWSVIGFGLAAPAWLAAQEQLAQPPARNALADFLYAFLPMAVIGGILWLFLRKTQRSPFMQRSVEYYERSEQHMQRMEQLYERIAAALENRKDKSSDR